MAKIIQVMGLLLALQGVGGVLDGLGVHLWHGGFLVRHLPVARDYPLYAGIALIVLGLVAIVAADRFVPGEGRS